MTDAFCYQCIVMLESFVNRFFFCHLFGPISFSCMSSWNVQLQAAIKEVLSTCIGCARWVDLSAVHTSWPGSKKCSGCWRQRAEDCWFRPHEEHPKQRLLQENHWRQSSANFILHLISGGPNVFFESASQKIIWGNSRWYVRSDFWKVLKFGCKSGAIWSHLTGFTSEI